MPARKTPLVIDQIYHVFNRGINKQPLFFSTLEYKRAIEMAHYYSYENARLRYSKFLLLNQEEKKHYWLTLTAHNQKLVDIICFCFMPNHFHFLLEQKADKGISNFMSKFQNSYTRCLNTKHKFTGPILQGQFKSVHVEDDNQLIHLSRYIHLNPYTAFIVKDQKEVLNYRWSSFPEYSQNLEAEFCTKERVLSNFKNKGAYTDFVLNNADYQRELGKIKHLLLEDKP